MSRISSLWKIGIKDQQKAIQPILAGRKIVLATNVAETSLTIEGIETVIDSGLRKGPFMTQTLVWPVWLPKKYPNQKNQRMGRAEGYIPGFVTNCGQRPRMVVFQSLHQKLKIQI